MSGTETPVSVFPSIETVVGAVTGRGGVKSYNIVIKRSTELV